MNKIGIIAIVLTCIFFMFSCKSDYDKYVRRELATGIVNDSLIFGMRMGQTQKDFYARCWELNAQELIAQGNGNKMARYTEPLEEIADSTLQKDMHFYGIFDDEKIMRGMEMNFQYTTWAPWNEERQADSLAVHLIDDFMTDYGGNAFISIDLPKIETKAFVKIDGNRQILIYPFNAKDVKVKIEDLSYKLNRE